MRTRNLQSAAVLLALLCLAPLHAELRLPRLFGDHMVLQRDQPCPIWGWDDPGTPIRVEFAGQTLTAVAGADGRWQVSLPASPASAEPRTLRVTGSSARVISDVLVGEVWLCSGQSNMAWPLANSWNGDLETLAAANPQLRIVSVPIRGTQEPQDDFEGAWSVATPGSVGDFSAIGYYFGRDLQRTLNVPVGLIDNAWGGSAAESWMRRDVLENDGRFADLMANAARLDSQVPSVEDEAKYQQERAAWVAARDQAVAEKRPLPAARAPRSPRFWLDGNKRPANAFNGMLHPLIGFGLRGVIWYQGEANDARPAEYAQLFPTLIEHWREIWGQEALSFYWVQLADFKPETERPGESNWAALREAQTGALRLPRTGQAVITDLGEAQDIHPRNKQTVATRLARIALSQDYGFALPCRSPEYRSHRVAEGRMIIEFDTFGSRLRTFDTKTVRGFALRAASGDWQWAEAELLDDHTVAVWNGAIPLPDEVRYAWSDNPVCNLISVEGLPVTPFRTDGP